MITELTKRQIRYWCFRFRTEVEGGAPAIGAPEGLKEHFEKLEWFSNWQEFSLMWDVKVDSPLEMIQLKENAEEEWQKVVGANAKELVVHKGKQVKIRDSERIDGK